MEIQQIRHFVALAEDLHFGRAAARLNIAQSALSQSIRRLEDSLEAVLLTRTKRNVRLSPAGNAFLTAAQDLLVRAGRAEALAKRAASEFGVLRINSFGPARQTVLPAALRRFVGRWPDVHVELKDHSHPPVQIEDLRNGSSDIAFVNTAMGDLQMMSDVDDVEFETIERWPFIAAVPADNPLAKRKAIDLQDLKDFPFIMFPLDLAPRLCSTIFSACRECGFAPKVRHEVAHVFSMLSLVAAGRGVALVRTSAQTLVQDGVRFVRLRNAPSYLYQEMAVAWIRDDFRFPLDAFVAIVRECRDAQA